MTNLSFDLLYQKLGYTFNDVNLLVDALSHRSYHGKNNERLEFLGDSVLNFVIAAALYRRSPLAQEGELSRLRANLVCEETLAEMAKEFELGHHLRLGLGELKSGGPQRISILADAMEAVIGAIYIDGGMAVCEQQVLSWYATRFDNMGETPELKDPKTRLQEYLQAHKLSLPHYAILSVEGAEHQQIFHVECSVAGLLERAEGQGSSRRRAEQEAAQKFLGKLSDNG